MYLAIYYRLLAFVAMAGLVVAASALYVVMAFLGAAVTLAGVVGIVVSIGVTVDSAVVYFEAMKEQVRSGVTMRAAADRAFDIAWSTILKANVASLLGAAILYWLAIGPVRGFAFYLGAMTILDLVFMYLFIYPATALIARSGQGRHPGRFGMSVRRPDPSGRSGGPGRAGSVIMNRLARAYRGDNDFNFPTWSRRLLIVSAVLIVASIVSLFTRGLSLSLEFEGGSSWAVESQEFTQDEASDVLADFDAAGGAKYQEATGADGTRVLRITSQVDDVNTGSEIANALAEAAGLEAGEVTVSTVGPSWGDDITRQAVQSLIWFSVLVAAYLAWRLEPTMALAGMLGVVHDVIITVGIYSLLGWEVTPATVIAFLTILGFSLYDTVVVFDRMQDGVSRYSRSGQYTYTMIARRTLNQSLMRCVNTSITTLLPIFSMLFIGGYLLDQPLLIDFSRALHHRAGARRLVVVVRRLTDRDRAQGARAAVRRHPQAPGQQGRRRHRHPLARPRHARRPAAAVSPAAAAARRTAR